jgi:hypothetical protein
MKPWYFVCMTCNAKWYSRQAACACPRCGTPHQSHERMTPPWESLEQRGTLHWIEDQLREIRELLVVLIEGSDDSINEPPVEAIDKRKEARPTRSGLQLAAVRANERQSARRSAKGAGRKERVLKLTDEAIDLSEIGDAKSDKTEE